MSSLGRIATRVAIIVLGLTPVLKAQDTGGAGGGPIFCPPLDQFLTPTLLDALLYPGITFR
jgi:hypothetical protein